MQLPWPESVVELSNSIHGCGFCAGEHRAASPNTADSEPVAGNLQNFRDGLCGEGAAFHHSGVLGWICKESDAFARSSLSSIAKGVLPSHLQESLKSVIAQYNASQLLTMREVSTAAAIECDRMYFVYFVCFFP
jgi:hypothetical protein